MLDLWNYKATVVNVVDGDTIDATIRIGFLLTTTQRLRFLGVNCPEVHGPTRSAGLAAAEFTRQSLLGKDVVVHTEKDDVFGRWLAVVYVDGASFNQRLLDEGFAVPFMTAAKSLPSPPS